MDGTASLIYLLAAKEAESLLQKYSSGWRRLKEVYRTVMGLSYVVIVHKRNIALVFTGDEFADGEILLLKPYNSKR